jgi:hypothetical protein
MNDDGFAFLTPEEREERIDYYHDNNIGWVARPKHNDNGYVRRGKFKKASNMNFALNISRKVETTLRAHVESKLMSEKTDRIDAFEEETIYKEALAEVLAADPRAMAAGNIRVGEFILIVDSDTQVVSYSLMSQLWTSFTNFPSSQSIVFFMEQLKCSCPQR